MIKLSLEQEHVYDRVLKFFNKNEKGYKVLNGYAGTGKSTLISEVLKALRSGHKQVAVITYTGRAASILKNKGVHEARTIHSLIYYPVIINGEVLRYDKRVNNLNKMEELNAIDCFIIDECSMINEQLFDDIMELGKPALFVGDNAQLPPISNDRSKKPFDLFKTIHYKLETIHRQALNSPIIRLSKIVRETGKLDKNTFEDNKHLVFMRRNEIFSFKHLAKTFYDVLLCGVNKTRYKLNDKFRTINKHNDFNSAQIGESVICLRNKTLKGKQFYNGERYRVVDVKIINQADYLQEMAKKFNVVEKSKVKTYFLESMDIPSKEVFEVDIPDTSWDELEPKQKNLGYFGFAYSLTVHKSQGSEFKNVGFVNENVEYFLDQKAFMYTAITRAKEKLTIYI
jgi:exodeoxyribonuclease-5